MFGYGTREKMFLFILGILVIIISLIGLAISFEFMPFFIENLPKDLRIYFGILAFFGLISLGASFMKSAY